MLTIRAQKTYAKAIRPEQESPKTLRRERCWHSLHFIPFAQDHLLT